MIAKLRAAGLVWPTLMTVIALPILAGLGTWQMQRKTWKEQLIARVKAGATAAPVPLAELAAKRHRCDHTEFRRVVVEGHVPTRQRVPCLGARRQGAGMEQSSRHCGWRSHWRRTGAIQRQIVLVMRGVVDEATIRLRHLARMDKLHRRSS